MVYFTVSFGKSCNNPLLVLLERAVKRQIESHVRINRLVPFFSPRRKKRYKAQNLQVVDYNEKNGIFLIAVSRILLRSNNIISLAKGMITKNEMQGRPSPIRGQAL